MRIEWMAHACFKVTYNDGRVVVFDPYDDYAGYNAFETEADIVVCSHSSKGHCGLNNIKGDYKLITSTGVFEEDGIVIEGINTKDTILRDEHNVENRAYKVTAEGITIVHLGDINHIIDKDIAEKIGHADILMIPVGGKGTVNGKDAVEICRMLEPNIILPMHYKTIFLQLPLDTVFPFTDAAAEYFDRSHIARSYLDITAGGLKKRSRIIVMDAVMDE